MNLFLQQFIGKQSPAQYCSLIKTLPRAWRWALLAAPLLALPVPAGAELILANYSASKPLKIMPIGDSITDDCSINGAWRFYLQPLLETNRYPFRFVGRQASSAVGSFTKINQIGRAS